MPIERGNIGPISGMYTSWRLLTPEKTYPVRCSTVKVVDDQTVSKLDVKSINVRTEDDVDLLLRNGEVVNLYESQICILVVKHPKHLRGEYSLNWVSKDSQRYLNFQGR